MNNCKGKKKVAVVVIHGTGDPQPGDTLRQLTNSLSQAPNNIEFPSDLDTHWLLEPQCRERISSRKPPLMQFFPVSIREGETDECEFIFAETYWGSASQIGRGWLGVIRGFLQLFVGISTIIEGTKAKKSAREDQYFKDLAKLASNSFSGPILASNMMLISAFLIYYLKIRMSIEIISPWLTVIVSSLLMIVVGFLIKNNYRRLGISSIVIGCLWPVLGLFFQGLGLFRQGSSWQQLGIAAILPLGIVFCLAIMLIVILVLWYASSVCFSGIRGHRKVKPSKTISLLAISLQYLLWSLIMLSIWRILLQLMPADDQLVAPLYEQVTPTDGLQWINVSILLCTCLCIWIIRQCEANRRSQARTDKGENARPVRRLVVNQYIGVCLIILTLFGIIYFLVISIERASGFNALYAASNLCPEDNIDACIRLLGWIHQSIESMSEFTNKINERLARILLFLVPLLLSSFRVVLDLVNDVILYVYQVLTNGQSQPEVLVSDPQDIDEDENNLDSFLAVELSQGQAMGYIQRRCFDVIQYVLKHRPVNQLVLVSHSQGTVIAADVLNKISLIRKIHDGGNVDDAKVILVTMGSPLQHLYQHYFPGYYPQWDHPYWNRLNHIVKRWINIYRIDDYVGTQVHRHQNCDEYGVGTGGHLGYWSDANVMEQLKQLF